MWYYLTLVLLREGDYSYMGTIYPLSRPEMEEKASTLYQRIQRMSSLYVLYVGHAFSIKMEFSTFHFVIKVTWLSVGNSS